MTPTIMAVWGLTLGRLRQLLSRNLVRDVLWGNKVMRTHLNPVPKRELCLCGTCRLWVMGRVTRIGNCVGARLNLSLWIPMLCENLRVLLAIGADKSMLVSRDKILAIRGRRY